VRTYSLDVPPGEAADTVQLMFEILGWRPVAAADRPRLQLRGTDPMLTVAADEPALAAVLARNGLDRLLLPLSLPALEQLMVCAG
jgi:hypothetical protein